MFKTIKGFHGLCGDTSNVFKDRFTTVPFKLMGKVGGYLVVGITTVLICVSLSVVPKK